MIAAAVAEPWPVVGRQPGEPRTTLGRWLRELKLSAPQFADCIAKIAKLEHIPADAVPAPKSIAGVIGGCDRPGLVLMLLIRTATSGAVDLEHWVAESLSRS